jgi:2-dehydro-3-deoxygluconokinase
MKPIPVRSVRAIGEPMVEMAPVGDGLYRRGFAGDTFNTAWHMARWLPGQADVGMVTRLGQDSLSDAFVAEMAADGMAMDGVSRDPVRRMGLYLIELNGVERSFHYWRDTSAARGLADDPAILAKALAGAGLVHLSGITLAILSPAARETLFQALAAVRSRGRVVAFDPNIRPRLWASADEMRKTIARMLALTDIALPSLDDETAHFGDRDALDTVRRMAGAGVGEVVVKDGAGPVTLALSGQVTHLPTPPVADIRDTTGAGDAFNAGYLAARVMGQGAIPAVTAGQRLARLVLSHHGARAPKDALGILPTP